MMLEETHSTPDRARRAPESDDASGVASVLVQQVAALTTQDAHVGPGAA
jgi:hypothetical protein